ncbi:MAG: hypothetical protein AAFO94_13125 [Bacteroidota bacterium]
MSYKRYLLLCLLLTTGQLAAQKWQNPAEKYLEAYKAYTEATCPIPEDGIQHFVYFSRDRHQIHKHPFLVHPRFAGAQIMYTWKELEPQKGQYDFSKIEADLSYLQQHGKKLFVQLQDVTFYPKYKAVPNYLLTDEYDGGVVAQVNDQGKAEGWVAKRWNKKVRQRFALLLGALGKNFDGRIEGINLQESAIGVSEKTDDSFSAKKYAESLKENMLALKQAFAKSTTMIYANFMPGEWLPWEDEGYLRGLYEYGNEIGVGLGAPDLMVTRKAQLNHPLALMHEGDFNVPLGIAVQDGNYVGKTGADADYDERAPVNKKQRNSKVPMLHGFAKDFLKVKYMFWVNQAPYFERDVLPCFGLE